MIWLIPILSGLTAFLSSYVMQKMQQSKNGNNAMAGQMRTLLFVTPLMSLYFAFILPGAIGIYWIFNNVFTMAQEIVLTKIPAAASRIRRRPRRPPASKRIRKPSAPRTRLPRSSRPKKARAAAEAARIQKEKNAKKKKGGKVIDGEVFGSHRRHPRWKPSRTR